MGGEMAHLHVLADDIGPRPATTDAEAHAADYIEAVFAARGLDVERQEFNTPRTTSWAFAVYYLLVIAAAVGAHFTVTFWPALVVSVLVAVVMWFDLDTKWGLSSLMLKGPSQNIVARHVPKARRGERLRRVVIVAHYDSAKASLAFSPALAKNHGLWVGLTKAAVVLVPITVAASAFPATEAAQPWLWYATLAVAAYLLAPLFVAVHRQLFARPVDGANDNATGVATMLGVMETVVPEPEAGFVPKPVARRHGDTISTGSEQAVDDELLSYSPSEAPETAGSALPDDFSWADATAGQPARGQRMLEFDTIEFDAVGGPARMPDRSRIPDSDPEAATDPLGDTGSMFADEPPPRSPDRSRGRTESGVSGWLGLADDFDARRAGRKIGTWDNFDETDDDDDFGLKGGWAGDDPIGDPDFAGNEAARIRRRVTEAVDREYQEKEVWFVATGAGEVGARGMRAFLKEYEEDLRDAVIINVEGVGAGALYWVTAEGVARRYRSDRRLVSLAKRVSRENNLLVRPRAYKGPVTDATAALARRYRAISVMGFDVGGRIPDRHWYTDTSENVAPELVELASAFVAAMVRDV